MGNSVHLLYSNAASGFSRVLHSKHDASLSSLTLLHTSVKCTAEISIHDFLIIAIMSINLEPIKTAVFTDRVNTLSALWLPVTQEFTKHN